MKTHCFKYLCTLLIGALALAWITQAKAILSTEPVLTLNSDMHTARISRVSTDAAGHILLTVSYDKSAKIWDLESGKLIKTLRIPIGEDNEGMLYAGTLSPDGRIAALGGWTEANGNSDNIYFFDVANDTMLYRIGGLPDEINDLEFSPDGRYLAAGLWGETGVRIWKSNDGFRSLQGISPPTTLSGYEDSVYNIAWASDGRLASVSYDGKVRLYDQNFRLIGETSKLAGKQPFSLAFSPDTRLLAVGFSDSPRLQVLDANSLNLLFEPNIKEANTVDQSLNKVCFSANGKYLVAGGNYSKYQEETWWRMIRIWENGGRGSYRDIAASKNSIMDIKALAGGGFVLGGSYPDWAFFDGKWNIKSSKRAETYDYGSLDKSHLRISRSGSKIGVWPIDSAELSFDLEKRSLSKEQFSAGKQYSESRHNLRISDWSESSYPKLNSRTLNFLEQNEKSYCTDIALDGQSIVFGADWYIYCLDAQGIMRWDTPTQATARCINISDNGKVALAGLNDGTLRWYRMTDGKLLLNLYLHPDGTRWLLWTPSGYYDCSAGAEDLIGWHLNQGEDKEALYFPVSRFRSRFYRPDVIDNILVSYDEDAALQLANLESGRKESSSNIQSILPPVVRIISPSPFEEVNQEELTIRYSAESPGGEPILNVRFMIDGRPVDTIRGLAIMDSQNTFGKTIKIPARDISIQVLAENKNGWSSPAEVSVRWKGKSVTADALKPDLYVLAIGVSSYQNPDYTLKYAAKDARDFSATLLSQKGGLYRDVVIRTLTDKQASKDEILDGLEWIQRQTTSRDIAIIFLAGHGINDNSGSFYFMPYEANIESLRRTCLMFSELKYTAENLAGKVLLFVDACHSGNVWGTTRAVPDVNILVNELADTESGAVVYTSSTGRQYSLESDSWGNGAFTKALIEGFGGKADLFDKGTITIKTLDAYLAQRVKELTKGQQSPTAVIPRSIPDFPIGIKK